MMFSWISTRILDLLGWKITGHYPGEIKKFIIIVMPHTSNWDFPLGILLRSRFKADIKFLGKKELFRPPLGGLFRWLGGYPVDRSRKGRLVDEVADIFSREETFALTIAPEGTRRKVDKLKTGFYYIALKAGVPIVMIQFDYRRREVLIREPFYPTGNKEADFAVILDFFKSASGKHPERGIDERVRF